MLPKAESVQILEGLFLKGSDTPKIFDFTRKILKRCWRILYPFLSN